MLSVAMIVKNEQQNLPRCLESLKGLFAELIVVDTGSIDQTIKIAKDYGAKVNVSTDIFGLNDFFQMPVPGGG